MAQARLSEAVLRATVEAVRQHGSQSRAARALNIPVATLHKRYNEACRVFDIPRGAPGLPTRAPELPPVVDAPRPADPPPALPCPVETPRADYEREWAVWQKAVGIVTSRYRGACAREARVTRRKILCVSDPHVPFHNREFVATMLERERDVDLCLLMGDLGDAYALSRFIKYEHVPYETELAAITLFVEELSAAYPEVAIMGGNHDARLEKHLREKLAPDFIEAILAMTGGSLNPLDALVRRFTNVRMVGRRIDGHQVPWVHQIGDAVFLHAEKYSKVPGSALRQIEEWLADNELVLGLASPWRFIFQAHTHTFACFPWHADRMLIECPCLQQTPGYALSARIAGRTQRRGYVTLEQVEGRTDPNAIRFTWLDHPSADLSGEDRRCA